MQKPLVFDFNDPKSTNAISLTIDSLLEPVVGYADKIVGNAHFDPEHPEQTTGTLRVAVASIRFSNDGYTRSVRGYGLQESKFPELICTLKRIVTGRVVRPGLYEGQVEVDFTAKGVTNVLTVPLRVQYLPGRARERDGINDGDLLVVRTTFLLSRKAFGIAKEVPEDLASDLVEVKVALVGTCARTQPLPQKSAPPTSPKPLGSKVKERMAFYKVSGASVAVVKNFQLAWVEYFGRTGADKVMPINEKTSFPCGAMGGPVAAALALKCVQDGTLGLDTDIHRYLKRWRVPGGEKVTIRELLTQTSGFTFHKYPGYVPGTPVPTLLQTLPKQLAHPRRYVLAGENNAVLQVVLEDATGKSVTELLYATLGRGQSAYYAFPESESYVRLAQGHDEAGKPLPHGGRVYPQLLASGLWSCAEEYAQFVAGILAAAAGKGKGVLSPALAKLLLACAFSREEGESGHCYRGGNAAGYYCHSDLWPERGDAVVVFANRDLCWEFSNELKAIALA